MEVRAGSIKETKQEYNLVERSNPNLYLPFKQEIFMGSKSFPF